MTPRLISLGAGGVMLGVSERTVKRLVANGDLKTVHVGGSTRLKVADVEAVDQLAPRNGATP